MSGLQVLVPAPSAAQGAHLQEAGLEAQQTLKPRAFNIDICFPSDVLTIVPIAIPSFTHLVLYSWHTNLPDAYRLVCVVILNVLS